MALTKRKKSILRKIVKDYIKTAKPVSSDYLKEKHRMDVSPATIRAEMKELDEMGYLFQPHHSAGRIPTDKGYRFFVDDLMENEICFRENVKILKKIQDILRKEEDEIKIIQEMTKEIADITSNLAVSYLSSERIVFKEGWEDIFKEPEFKDVDFVENFIEGVKYFEENIDNFSSILSSDLEVLIGKESPFQKLEDASMIFSSFCFRDEDNGNFFFLLGPKRMDYNKGINVLHYLPKIIEKYDI